MECSVYIEQKTYGEILTLFKVMATGYWCSVSAVITESKQFEVTVTVFMNRSTEVSEGAQKQGFVLLLGLEKSVSVHPDRNVFPCVFLKSCVTPSREQPGLRNRR